MKILTLIALVLVIMMLLIIIYLIFDIVKYYISSRFNSKSPRQQYLQQSEKLKKLTNDSVSSVYPQRDVTFSRFFAPFGSLGQIHRSASKSPKKLF